jgi:hypothetical protein
MLKVPHLDHDKPQSGCGILLVREIATPIAMPIVVPIATATGESSKPEVVELAVLPDALRG